MSSSTDTQQAPLKIITVVFVLKTNTINVRRFLQVQHYWGVSCELLNPGL